MIFMRRVMGIKSNIFLKFLIFGKKIQKSKQPNKIIHNHVGQNP